MTSPYQVSRGSSHLTAQSRPDTQIRRAAHGTWTERFFIRPSKSNLCYVGDLTTVRLRGPKQPAHLPNIARYSMVQKKQTPQNKPAFPPELDPLIWGRTNTAEKCVSTSKQA